MSNSTESFFRLADPPFHVPPLSLDVSPFLPDETTGRKREGRAIGRSVFAVIRNLDETPMGKLERDGISRNRMKARTRYIRFAVGRRKEKVESYGNEGVYGLGVTAGVNTAGVSGYSWTRIGSFICTRLSGCAQRLPAPPLARINSRGLMIA